MARNTKYERRADWLAALVTCRGTAVDAVSLSWSCVSGRSHARAPTRESRRTVDGAIGVVSGGGNTCEGELTPNP